VARQQRATRHLGQPPQETLPPDIQSTLTEWLDPQEEIQLAVSTDLRLDGRYGSAYLLATDRQLLAISPNGARPQILRMPLPEITSVEMEELYATHTLKIRSAAAGMTVAVFSKSLEDRFAEVPEHLAALVRQARPQAPAPVIRHSGSHHARPKRRCERCGRVIPQRMGVCPYCLDKGRLLRRFLGYSIPYWPLATFSLSILLAATFIGLTPPLLMRTLIDNVFRPADSLAQSARSTAGAVEAIRQLHVQLPLIGSVTPSQALVALVLALLVINVSRNALGAVRSYLLARLGQRITLDLRREVYRHLHRLSLSFYNDRDTGRIMNSVTQDVGRLQDFLSDGLQEIIRNILTILIIVSILFYLNAGLALYVLLPTPLIVLVTVRFGRRLHLIYHRLWRRWAALSSLLADVIPGVREVKAFAQENREVRRFDTRTTELLEGELRAARVRSVFSPIMAFLTSLGTLIIWWVGGHKVLNTDLSLGSFVAFTGYMWQFYGPVEALCRLNHRFQRAATSAERVFEVLDTTPDVADSPQARTLPRIQGRVEFRVVSFAYEPGKPVLHDLSFSVEPGEMIGLVGHSGAGKSTIINILCRFYDVEDGAILVDGHDLRDVQLKSLRDQISVVLQQPFLFNGSVAENIAYGKPGAGPEEIVAAAKAANAHEFVMNLPDAYDAQLGERAVRLSGGERQRVTIARALAQQPSILLLDEPTSHLDINHQVEVFDLLYELNRTRGLGILCVTHDLNFASAYCARLILMHEGRVTSAGVPAEVITAERIRAVYGVDVLVEEGGEGAGPRITPRRCFERIDDDRRTPGGP